MVKGMPRLATRIKTNVGMVWCAAACTRGPLFEKVNVQTSLTNTTTFTDNKPFYILESDGLTKELCEKIGAEKGITHVWKGEICRNHWGKQDECGKAGVVKYGVCHRMVATKEEKEFYCFFVGPDAGGGDSETNPIRGD